MRLFSARDLPDTLTAVVNKDDMREREREGEREREHQLQREARALAELCRFPWWLLCQTSPAPLPNDITWRGCVAVLKGFPCVPRPVPRTAAGSRIQTNRVLVFTVFPFSKIFSKDSHRFITLEYLTIGNIQINK